MNENEYNNNMTDPETADIPEAENKNLNTVQTVEADEALNSSAGSNTYTSAAESETANTISESTNTVYSGSVSQSSDNDSLSADKDPYNKYSSYVNNVNNTAYPNQQVSYNNYNGGQYQASAGVPYNGTPASQYMNGYNNPYSNGSAPGYNAYGQAPYGGSPQSPGSLVDSIYPGTSGNEKSKKAKKERGKFANFLIGAAMSAAFGLIAAGVFIGVTYFYKEKNPELFETSAKQIEVTTTDNKNTRLNLDPATETSIVPSTSVIDGATFTGTDVSQVVEKAMPSIVSIDCETQIYSPFYGVYTSPTAGSGIIIEKSDSELIIATNNHVVANSEAISVTFCDGTKAAASIKGKDEVADLAVIAVKLNDISKPTLDTITIATLGNSDDVQIGEMAIAIGNSLGYGQSVTVGYISAKDRDITIDGQVFSNLLQTDAAINPGNSGGALMNLDGEVIGINNAKIGGSSVEGMGYAIPISRAQNILADFATRETLTTEEQGFLGVSIQTVSEETAKIYNWPMGAYIASVVEGGAAQAAGIQVGDIITAVNDTNITSDVSLVEKIQSLRHGTEITVTLQRLEDGEFVEHKFTLVLGKRPVEE